MMSSSLSVGVSSNTIRPGGSVGSARDSEAMGMEKTFPDIQSPEAGMSNFRCIHIAVPSFSLFMDTQRFHCEFKLRLALLLTVLRTQCKNEPGAQRR